MENGTIDTGTEKVRAHKDRNIGILVFNNPLRRNAISSEMWQAIPQIMAEFDQDPEIRSIILSGAGESAFVAGADIAQFENERQSAEAGQHYDKMTYAALDAIYTSSTPTIARIHGYCIGGGVAIALCCDIRVATEDTTFAIPAARLGLSYPVSSTNLLVATVGPAKAKEMIFTARSYKADEAFQMQLVNHVCSEKLLDPTISSICGQISKNAPLSISASKRAINEIIRSEETDFDAIEEMVRICYESEDYIEGRRAFLSKREPSFQGH